LKCINPALNIKIKLNYGVQNKPLPVAVRHVSICILHDIGDTRGHRRKQGKAERLGPPKMIIAISPPTAKITNDFYML